MSTRIRIVTRAEKSFEVGVGDYVQVGGTPHLYRVAEVFPNDKCRPVRLEEEVPYQDVKRHGMTFFPSLRRITGVRHSSTHRSGTEEPVGCLNVSTGDGLQSARLKVLEARVDKLTDVVSDLVDVVNKAV